MENFKYSLAKRGKNFCPACNRKTFVPYIDASGNPLHTSVGKCDRADNCGHHYTPKQYFTDKQIPLDKTAVVTPYNNYKRLETPKPSYFDVDIVKRSLTGYDNNRLIQFLTGVVGADVAMEAANRYIIGSSKHWDGATVFWQIDQQGRVHAGKIMQYDQTTGKRIKEPVNRISWAHTVMKMPDFNLSQCLFGEHLLEDATKMVAIVESEKTAIIASCYLPNFIWLACGGSEGLNTQKCAVLKGRNIILYPDASQYGKWSDRAKELSKTCSVSVSDLIEQNATDEERSNGFDIADYLIRFPLSDFVKKQPETKSPEIVEIKQPKDFLDAFEAEQGYSDAKPRETKETQKPAAPVSAKPINIQKGNTPAFIDAGGRIFIPTRKNSYAFYPSAIHLYSPSVLPVTVPWNKIDTSGMSKIFINY